MTDRELIQALTDEFVPRIRELCADDKLDCDRLCAGNILTAKCIVFQAAERLAALQAENAELRTQHRTEHCEASGYDCAELGRLRAAGRAVKPINLHLPPPKIQLHFNVRPEPGEEYNMTLKEVAEMFNGRQYGKEGTQADFDGLEELGYVVVLGSSDDLCELRGAINDKADCYDGGTIYLDADGVFYADCENEDCKLLQRHLKTCKSIEAVWGADGYSWTYKTDIPHECFDIYEDGEKYCRGIVFKMPMF